MNQEKGILLKEPDHFHGSTLFDFSLKSFKSNF